MTIRYRVELTAGEHDQLNSSTSERKCEVAYLLQQPTDGSLLGLAQREAEAAQRTHGAIEVRQKRLHNNAAHVPRPLCDSFC
jgi:hypothetical protein